MNGDGDGVFVEVTAGGRDDDAQAMAQLNLLAHAQRGRERLVEQQQYVHDAARDAVRARLLAAAPGASVDDLADEVAALAIAAALQAMRDGPPE